MKQASTAAGQQCCHCGTKDTVCWRKGPPEKPCLCNACGARWLVKNDLEGYWPGKKCTPTTSSRPAKPRNNSQGRKSSTAFGGDSLGKRKLMYEKSFQQLGQDYHFVKSSKPLSVAYLNAPWIFVSDGPTTSDSENEQYDSTDYSEDPDSHLKMSETGHSDSELDITQRRQCAPPLFHRRPRKQARPVACEL